jgi:hypothetical protein
MTDLKREYKRQDTFIRRWAALFILIAFFVLSWGGQFFAQMEVVKQESAQHGQEFSMNEFMPQFWSSTFENWQSEWLQLATQAVLIAALADYIFRKGNQDHYKTQLMIAELKEEINKKK